MIIPGRRPDPDVVIAREPWGTRVMAWYVAPHIAHMGRWGAKEPVLETVKAEVEKCDVVCANCHRERTYQRKVASGEVSVYAVVSGVEQSGSSSPS